MKSKSLKRLFSFIMAFAIVVTIAPTVIFAAEAPAGVQVTDVYSAWAELDIFMAQAAYGLGNESTYANFRGAVTAEQFDTMCASFDYELDYEDIKENMTRGEIITALYEIITEESSAAEDDAIDYFVQEKLIKGRTSGEYHLDKICTVEEMIVFSVRTYEHLKYLADEDSKGFFWRVSGGECDVYLLGSVHLADGSIYPFSKAIEEAFEASENLVVEVDMTAIGEEEMIYLSEKGTLSDGSTIKDYISEETYVLYKDVCEAFGLPALYYDLWQPWEAWRQLQALMMLAGGESAEAQIDALLGMDMRYMLRAVADGKNIVELESFKFQIDLLSSFSPELQEVLLTGILMSFNQEAETTEAQTEAMYSALLALIEIVKNGDEKALGAALSVDVEFENPLDIEYYEKFITDRDKGMAEGIDELLQDGSNGDYFVIVGAAHMINKKGIVALLKDMGYTVERIK